MFWKKSDSESPEAVKRSEALASQMRDLSARLPDLLKRRKQIEEERVRPAAEEVVVARAMQSRDALSEAERKLRAAIIDRDNEVHGFDLRLSEIRGELEVISAPVIFGKTAEWQTALSDLRKQIKLEKIESDFDVESGHRWVRFRSNSGVVDFAREKLAGAILALRALRWEPLSKIQKFIAEIEKEISDLDFLAMTPAKERVSEAEWVGMANSPDSVLQDRAWIFGGRIQKAYEPPQRVPV
jgi:hypothetical protein